MTHVCILGKITWGGGTGRAGPRRAQSAYSAVIRRLLSAPTTQNITPDVTVSRMIDNKTDNQICFNRFVILHMEVLKEIY